jgi:hypothetical protein
MISLQWFFFVPGLAADEKDYYGKQGSIEAPSVIAELWPGPPGLAIGNY